MCLTLTLSRVSQHLCLDLFDRGEHHVGAAYLAAFISCITLTGTSRLSSFRIRSSIKFSGSSSFDVRGNNLHHRLYLSNYGLSQRMLSHVHVSTVQSPAPAHLPLLSILVDSF